MTVTKADLHYQTMRESTTFSRATIGAASVFINASNETRGNLESTLAERTRIFDIEGVRYITNAATCPLSELKTCDDHVLSRSNPMLIGSAFNKRAAQYSFKMIEQLEKGDIIKVQTLPERIKPQGSTNLLAWFNRNPIDCRKDSNTIMIITDAIEASEYVNPNKLLNGTQSLPDPSDFVNIWGCNVVMFDIGEGRSDKETIHLRKMWGRYFEQTGANFIAVPL